MIKLYNVKYHSIIGIKNLQRLIRIIKRASQFHI